MIKLLKQCLYLPLLAALCLCAPAFAQGTGPGGVPGVAPTLAPLTSAQVTALFANASGCGTPSNVLTPQSGTCVAPGSAPVSSVFTRTGNVVAASGDYTVGQVTGAAPLASPALTGTPTAPTAAALTSTTQVATTANVVASILANATAFTNPQTAPAFFPQTKSAGAGVNYFDDFFSGANNASNNIGAPTGATCVVNTTYTDQNHPGNLLLTAGTAVATGTGITCGLQGQTADFVTPNSSLGWTWETAVYVPVLPGTTNGAFQAGFSTSPNSSPWTGGIEFYLSSANGTANDWYCRYSSTSTDSSTLAVVGWQRLTMVNDGTKVHWYIAGSEVCGTGVAIASIPSATQYAAAWSAVSLTASTSVTMAVDYVAIQRTVTR